MQQREAVDIGRLIDGGRWSGYQRWLVSLAALAVVFDGIDNQLMGIAVPTIMREWSLPRSAFSSVISLGFLGMMTGGAIAGLLGDRFGRRIALVVSVLVFGTMTMMVAFVDGVGTLGVLRFMTGLGLGGAIPNAAALAAEYVPLSHRPMAVTVTIVCVPAGAMLAGLIAIPALPLFGWRTLFLIGGAMPVVAAVLFRVWLPESPRYLARYPARHAELAAALGRMGHQVPAHAVFIDTTEAPVGRATIGTLFTAEWRGDTIALLAAFFSGLLSVYLGFSWIPSLLTAAGFSPSIASSGITAFNMGGVIGALGCGAVIARAGSRVAMVAMAGGAAISAGAMGLMDLTPGASLAPIVALLTITGALINGVQTTMYALAANVYPAAVRATGVGTAVSFGRIGAVLTGYIGTWALEAGGSRLFFWVIATSMVVCAGALASVRRHIPRR